LRRQLLLLLTAFTLALSALAVSTGGAGAASGGGCQLAGTANFTPGLSNTAQNFNYSFGGALTGCASTDSTAPKTGTVSAGQVVTAASGEQFQEPVSTGSGTCANGTTSGITIITWADGSNTVASYSTTSAGAAVNLSGTVIPSVTIPAINPAVGQPTSETITTTRYAGDTVLGLLAFQADPTQCAGAGVSSAAINGATALGSTT
jgi:hypothetical protein